MLVLFVSLAFTSCKRDPVSLQSPLLAVAQDTPGDSYSVYWSDVRETYTNVTPTLTLVHQIRVGESYSETFSTSYEWYEIEYIDTGVLEQFSYTWPSTPGQRQRRTFWQVDQGTFDAFVERYGNDLVCGPLMLCVYEVDDTGGRIPADDGWYDAGVTGYRVNLPFVGGE